MKQHVDFIFENFCTDVSFIRDHLSVLRGFGHMDDILRLGDYGVLVSLAAVALFEAGYLTYPEFAELIEVLNYD